MIANLQPYPEYKESGLPWVGRVPQGWKVQRTKWLFRHRKEINTSRTHTNVLSLTLRGVVNNDPDDPEGLVPKDYDTYQFFGKGDLVFKLIDLENLRTSRVGLVHEDGIMSSAYVRLIPNNPASVRFFFLQFYDLYTRGVYNQLGAGVRSTLGPSDLLNLPICFPSPEEQAAMVRFLDYANGRLERAIQAKRKVIALLHEQKQAIIHRAVTRGLDPSVPLKPSGIPWLGDIPEKWETISLGAASDLIQTGPFGSQLHSHEYVEGGIPVINPSHIRDVRIFPDMSITILQSKASELERHKLSVGDIVAARRGELGRCGLVTATEQGWICGTGSLRICCKTSLFDPAYLVRLFSSQGVRDSLSLSSIGATMDNLNAGMVARLRLPLPPLDEQHRIVRLIEAEENQSGSAISTVEREIALLREYRTRLVADVATGKLDVREVARQLPEEAAEMEAAPDTEELSEPEPGEIEA